MRTSANPYRGGRLKVGADSGDRPLAPDDAFAVLGNETRMEILRTLAEVDEPLSFSELREHVGLRDSGQFNYHLEKLVGHFVEDTDEGYAPRRAGERIIEAVVSGAVTETPTIEPTRVEWPCSRCDASALLMSYRQERVMFSCTECAGNYDGSTTDDPLPEEQREYGYLGGLSLPPAAIQGRNPSDVLRAAFAWDFLERLALTHEICPRCSAGINRTLQACVDHDASEDLCESCNRRHQVIYRAACPNCPLESEGLLPTALHGQTDVLDFGTARGFNPVTPTRNQWEVMSEVWEQELVSVEPLRARVTYTLEGDALGITVDEDLAVVDVTETRESAME